MTEKKLERNKVCRDGSIEEKILPNSERNGYEKHARAKKKRLR
jgi:hypothetical protein